MYKYDMPVYASSLFNETSLHVRRYLKLLSRDSTTFTLIEVSKGLIVSETDIALRVELTGKGVGPREGRLTLTATAMSQITSWQQLWDRAQPMLDNAEQSLAG